MTTIRSIMDSVPHRMLSEMRERAVANYHDQQLKLTEMSMYVDDEIARLDRAINDAYFSDRDDVVAALVKELDTVKRECNTWLKAHVTTLSNRDKFHKKFHMRRTMRRGRPHSYSGFDKEVQRMTAIETARTGELYARAPDIKIGNDSILKFKNTQRPHEADLSGFDIKMFFHLVCGWTEMQGCGVFVRPSGRHISLSVFLPTFKGDTRIKGNRKVYVQLSREFGEWKWNGKKHIFDWKLTLSNIRQSMTRYYENVIDGVAGDCEDGSEGSDQVRRLDGYGDLAEFMSYSIMPPKPGTEYLDRAKSHVFGKGYVDHPDNVKARRELMAWYSGDGAHQSTEEFHMMRNEPAQEELEPLQYV